MIFPASADTSQNNPARWTCSARSTLRAPQQACSQISVAKEIKRYPMGDPSIGLPRMMLSTLLWAFIPYLTGQRTSVNSVKTDKVLQYVNSHYTRGKDCIRFRWLLFRSVFTQIGLEAIEVWQKQAYIELESACCLHVVAWKHSSESLAVANLCRIWSIPKAKTIACNKLSS